MTTQNFNDTIQHILPLSLAFFGVTVHNTGIPTVAFVVSTANELIYHILANTSLTLGIILATIKLVKIYNDAKAKRRHNKINGFKKK